MIIFKIHYTKKIGKNTKGHIVAKYKEVGKKSFYIPIDLNYFNCRSENSFNIRLLHIKYNYMYRNTQLILGLCVTDRKKEEFRYILKPFNKTYGDYIKFSKTSTKQPGDIDYIYNCNISDKLYNIEFIPKINSKICLSAKCHSIILNKQPITSILVLPSNNKKILSNKCCTMKGYADKIINYNKNTAGSKRLLGHRPKVRGTAMNACDHPHGGGEGKTPIGKKYICSFKGKNVKKVKTSRK